MATFTYEALNAAGKPQKGTVEASTSEEAVAHPSQGFFPTDVREQKVKKSAVTGSRQAGAAAKKKKKRAAGGRVKAKQLTTFTRQLSTLQDAGLPSCARSRSSKPAEARQAQERPHGRLRRGRGRQRLSEAMAKYPKAFDRLYTKMVAAGEIGGVLDIILQRLAEFMEKASGSSARSRARWCTPSSSSPIAVLILTGIMWFIIPKFEEIFTDFGVPPALTTLAHLGTSRWVAGGIPRSADARHRHRARPPRSSSGSSSSSSARPARACSHRHHALLRRSSAS
jgi:type IV pilus assembly protein PilC